ncbi:MAG: hypothetical protein ACI8ZF_000356 [Candidatus Midichloriaceae bacterium]|jgi:hypothetical protein
MVFPIEIKNNTIIASNDNVYISIKGTDHATSKQCFVKLDTGAASICEAPTATTDSALYSYKLSSLPMNASRNPEISLSEVDSGRIYFSINNPVNFVIDASNPGNISVVDPDGFKTRDPYYYTLYDKVEFTYNADGTWINPTAVDFFSIPIKLEQPTSISGYTKSGFSTARSSILSPIKAAFDAADSSTAWNKLFLKFGDTSTDLRLMSPGKAMNTNSGQPDPFPNDYLNNSTYGLKYIDSVWTYYLTNTIQIDCSELSNDDKFLPKLKNGYTFTGKVVENNFVFSNPGNEKTETIAKPDSISFYAGAVGSFNFDNHTVGVVIVKFLTSAFDVGLLPVADGVLLNSTYFESKKADYYQNNSLLPAPGYTQGPWYDLYSKSLHGFLGEHIYTFAYDDALKQDGTLQDPNAGKVTITLGDMSGTSILNPLADTSTYTVNIILGKNDSDSYYQLFYNGAQIKPSIGKIIGGKTLHYASVPIKVKFNGIDQDIYLKYPMVTPYTQKTDDIVITKISDTDYNLIFPGPPAGYTNPVKLAEFTQTYDQYITSAPGEPVSLEEHVNFVKDLLDL